MIQHDFYCRRCNTDKTIYTIGEVLYAPCPECGKEMINIHFKQTQLQIRSKAIAPGASPSKVVKSGHSKLQNKLGEMPAAAQQEFTEDDIGPIYEQIRLL